MAADEQASVVVVSVDEQVADVVVVRAGGRFVAVRIVGAG